MSKMKFKIIATPIFLVIAIILALTATNIYSQCCKMKDHGSHSGHNMQSSNGADTTIVRKGTIDVDSIDVNKDGFVYQDQMDWNVISDNTGSCSLCGMTLKKVSLQDAKENLKKNGFTVK
jgi:hypothetical protein